MCMHIMQAASSAALVTDSLIDGSIHGPKDMFQMFYVIKGYICIRVVRHDICVDATIRQ